MKTKTKNNIGVLDSGVGGLSVLAELYKQMPNQNFTYFGDTKNMPYGTKTPKEIYSFTKAILEFFISKDIKNVVFACNTTSAVAYNDLREYFKDKIKIFPLIQSVAKKAQDGLQKGDILAILATKATIESKKYDEEIKKYNKDIIIKGVDCTGFVEIVENRLYDDPSSLELIKSKLDLIKDAKRIILGCTHYPYLADIFKTILNKEYFNPASYLSQIVKEEIKNTDSSKGEIEFYVSKNPNEFKKSAKMFFDIQGEVNLVNL